MMTRSKEDTYVFHESIVASQTTFSIENKCLLGQTTLRFPRGKFSVRYYSLSTDREETAIVESLFVAHRLQSSLSRRGFRSQR
jgi:hypothetical protein